MGKVYKRKKRSCPMCKPHKTGGADRQTPRERARTDVAEEEIRQGGEDGNSEETDEETGEDSEVEYFS